MPSTKLTKEQADVLMDLLLKAAGSKAACVSDAISWAAEVISKHPGVGANKKAITNSLRRFFNEDDRRVLTPAVLRDLGIALSLSPEQIRAAAGLDEENGEIRPVPGFRVVRYAELLDHGFTEQQIWDASDRVDLAIAREEQSSIFGELHWLPVEHGMAIANRDPWSMLCLVDSVWRIWGYSFMAALLPEYFERAIAGDYHEPDVRADHTVPILPFSEPLNIFVFGIDTHPLLWRDPKSLESLGGFRLVIKIFHFLAELRRSTNYCVRQIAALGVTEKGRQLCEMAEMTKVRSFDRDGTRNDVYRLIPDPQ